jgi:hypothetical protein
MFRWRCSKDRNMKKYCVKQKAYINTMLKVKDSRNRPGVAQRVQGGLGSQISMTFGTRRWWGPHPQAPAKFTPQEMYLILIFTRGWVDPRTMVRSEGNMSLKNPVTPQRIDPGTVRLVEQRLNHYATPGLINTMYVLQWFSSAQFRGA